MKKTYYITIGLLFIMIAILNNCSGGGITSKPPISYWAEAVIKNTDGNNYLFVNGNGNGDYYKVLGSTIEEVSKNQYVEVEKNLSQNNAEIISDLEKIEKYIATLYNIKIVSNNYDGRNKMVRERDGITVVALLNDNFTFEKKNFLVSYPFDPKNSKYKLLHIVKDSNGIFSVKKELDLNDSLYIDVQGNKKVQLENLPYVSLTGNNNVYIPIVYNNEIIFYKMNDFAKTFYDEFGDYEEYFFKYRSVLLAFYQNDSTVIVYDKSSSGLDSKMVYKSIPINSSVIPTMLDIPLQKH